MTEKITTDMIGVSVKNTIIYLILYVIIGISFYISYLYKNKKDLKILDFLSSILLGTPYFLLQLMRNLIIFLKEI